VKEFVNKLISNFVQIRQWEPNCCMRTDTHTYARKHDEASSRRSQFCKCSKREKTKLKQHTSVR